MKFFNKKYIPLFSSSLLCFALFFSFTQCHFGNPSEVNENDSITDPIETYSLLKTDSMHGITIISLTENNPLTVRENILQYEIPETTFESKRTKLYSLLDALQVLYTFSEPNIFNIVDSMNYLAAYYLNNLLEDTKSLYLLIKHPMLSITTSPDKKLRVFSWDENAGMTFKTHLNVFQFQTNEGQLKSCLNESMESENDFNFIHAQIKNFYKLPSSNSNSLYLTLFQGLSCRTCYFKGVTAIEIINDSLNFHYPLFHDSLSYLIFNYTAEDKFTLSFNPKSTRLYYTWIQVNENNNDTISERFIFSNNFLYKQDD
ncbi:MAG: hypothetical protein PHI52_09715 [Bacteroidales bacterium]|nr:hypothetical protein [Bacteroidales bacterium]